MNYKGVLLPLIQHFKDYINYMNYMTYFFLKKKNTQRGTLGTLH